MRRVTASIAIAAAALLAGPRGGAVTAEAPIRVGASLALSGTYAALGQNQHRGYQLCVKHTNGAGGVLGRPIELTVHDDGSEPTRAARLYERLIAEEKMDLVFGPYSSPISEAVASVTERHKRPMLAHAATTSIFTKRRFVFMVLSPAKVFLEGLIELAARRGLRTVAFLHEDTLFAETTVRGAADLARRKGLGVVSVEGYPKGTGDFRAILTRLRALSPDVLGAGTYFDDAVAITRQMKELDLNPKMYGVTVGADLPKFHETLGRDAEFVYGATQWDPGVMTLRAGGLIPIARQYPGAREFVDSHKTAFPGADLSYHTAAGYAICQIHLAAVERARSLDGEAIRTAILGMDMNTVFGAFRVDAGGVQVAHRMLVFQWQDGKKVIVWPEELTSAKPRFPTPPWSQRP